MPQQPGDNAFVKMMLPFGDKILLCWVKKPSTGSCTWRSVSDLHELDYSFLFDGQMVVIILENVGLNVESPSW